VSRKPRYGLSLVLMESLLTWLCVSQKQSYRTDAAADKR